MAKHSFKIVIFAVALTILGTATPSLAAGSSQGNESHSAASWEAVLDFVGEWLGALFSKTTDTDSGVEYGPDVDSKGESAPKEDPTGDGSVQPGH